MNIYLLSLKRDSQWQWDSYDGHVVQAMGTRKVRELCPYRDEGNIWINSEDTFIKKIGTNNQKREKVLLSNFNSG